MSTIGDNCTRAHAILATAKGESLQYATALTGSLATLTGFVLHQDRIGEPVYNDRDIAEAQQFTATLKGPVTPVLAIGYKVKDLVTGFEWAVESSKIDTQQVCRLMRRIDIVHGPNRGGAA